MYGSSVSWLWRRGLDFLAMFDSIPPMSYRAVLSARGRRGRKKFLLSPDSREGACRCEGQPSRLCPSLPLAVCLGLGTDLGKSSLE